MYPSAKSPSAKKRRSRRGTLRGNVPVVCKHCGKVFPKAAYLAAHMKRVKTQQRMQMFMPKQLIMPPTELKKKRVIRKIFEAGNSRVIACTKWIPADWHTVAIWPAKKTEEGIWVFIQPLIFKERKEAN